MKKDNNLNKTPKKKLKFEVGDNVEFVKDIDLSTYPKTATGLIKISKEMIGKTYVIATTRGMTEGGKATKYKYGFYDSSGLVWCAEEEIKHIKQ